LFSSVKQTLLFFGSVLFYATVKDTVLFGKTLLLLWKLFFF